MTTLISLNGIVKDYRSKRALDGIDLEIKNGITGLLGPNGAGKSTLIKVLLGLVKVTAGTGIMLGHKLRSEGRAIRNKVGFMPEDDCYIPGMSGVEVVQFSACLAGLPTVEALRRAHEILDFCGMKQERYRTIETFSTGMRQKVKFAAAIVHDPEYLIFDEPTSGLDPEERELLLNRIKILSEGSGKSVLISTHILPDVQSICENVVILSNGKVVLNDSLEALNKTVDPTVSLRVIGDSAPLVGALKRTGCEVQVETDGQIVVASSSGDIVNQIWSAASQTSTPIRTLNPAQNSLEEIFMNTVAEAKDAIA